jgi:hypothetical protein
MLGEVEDIVGSISTGTARSTPSLAGAAEST